MRTIEATAIVTPDGKLTVEMPAPSDIAPGEHQIVLMIQEQSGTTKKKKPFLNFREYQVTPTPPDSTFRREEIYGDDTN